jgi:hypothetical protein
VVSIAEKRLSSFLDSERFASKVVEAMILDLLRAAEVLVLVFGGVIVFFALRSGRRTRNLSMFLLALGFAFVVAGGVVAGFLFELDGLDITTVEVMQATSQAVGFFIIVYSLMVMKE